MNDNREHQDMYWEHQTHKYRELKDEITEKVTNHTNKLIDNLENNFRQINENIERKQEEVFEIMFNRLNRALDDSNGQNISRTEIREIHRQIVYKIIDNQKLEHVEQLQSQQKKEKQQSQNPLYHSKKNLHQ